MKPSILFLALWAASADAFFPYRPDWRKASAKSGRGFSGRKFNLKTGSSTATERAAQIDRLRSKYRRDNEYFVLEAQDPDHDLAVGIDQDGADYSYFVEVEVGSANKPIYMLLDTGAGSSWIMGPECTTQACEMHNSFGPEDSDTFEQGSETFSIAYGSGSVKGLLATDTFHIAGMSVELEFGVANDTSDDFEDFPFDGILGMSMNEGVGQSFLSAMTEDSDVEANLFAVSLHRAEDGPNTGEIRFGSTDPDLYEGDISYTAIATDEDWAVEIEEMAFDGSAAGVSGMTCYIDTGTTFIFGPPEAVEMVHAVIPGAQSNNGQEYTVPCDTEDALTFTFSGVTYDISARDWIGPKSDSVAGACNSNIYGLEFVDGAWVLGDAFLKNVYAVFDVDEKRIGFAPQATETPSSTTTTMPMTTMPSSEVVVMTTFTTNNSTIVATSTVENSGPDMGMGGPETHSSGKPEETGTTEEQDDDSSAPRPANARCAAVFGIAAVIALVA